MELSGPTSLLKRAFSTAQREEEDKKGHAMPGGRYPIETPKDLTDAIDDYNRTGQDPAVHAHIVTQARRLKDAGKLKELPPSLVSKGADVEEVVDEVLKRLAERIGTQTEFDVDQAVIEKSDEQRYTFGPLYAPDTVDAHGEWTTPADLQKALHNYVRLGDRSLRKQHDRDAVAGEVVEACIWPYAAEVELRNSDGIVRKATLPAGTAYVGVVWSPEAWPLVKSGKIGGYSLGGRAIRIRDQGV